MMVGMAVSQSVCEKSGSSVKPYSVQEPSNTIDFSAPMILKPKSFTHAVTPEPHELIVGKVVSIPFLR